MLKRMLKRMLLMTLIAALSVAPAMAAPLADAKYAKEELQGSAQILKKIRKELVTLPYYSVFDNLAYKYEDGVVTLYGQVVRPTMRKDAERVVERIAGVDKVINRIEVLPLSPNDDRIRRATYRAIYRQPGLDRLALQAVPPIHIIVKRGNVTLEGVAPSRSAAIRAYHAARSVPGVFSVTNNLRIG